PATPESTRRTPAIAAGPSVKWIDCWIRSGKETRRLMPQPSENAMGKPTHPFDDDRVQEKCAVFGIHGHPDAAAHTALGLHALQHRRQEASGSVAFDGERFNAHRDLGLVGDIFSSEAVISRLPGHSAIGHNRYATSGETILRNVQPLFADLAMG